MVNFILISKFAKPRQKHHFCAPSAINNNPVAKPKINVPELRAEKVPPSIRLPLFWADHGWTV